MAGNLVPRTDGGSNLGTPQKEYGVIYAKDIGGTLADKLAKLNSPNFTGTPTAPTASVGTATTQIATTAFVDDTVIGKLTTHNTDTSAHADKFSQYLPLVGGTMTGSIVTQNGEDYIPAPKTSMAHNGIYRGKDFGTIASVAQLEAFLTAHEVSAGKFTDLYIGDYFVIQDGTYNKAWEIAAFDWYLNKGDSTALTKHHLVLFPKENLTTSYMNSTNTTEGGYYNSYMHQTVIPQVNTNLTRALGNHLLERRALLSNTIDATGQSNACGTSGWKGCSSAWSWYSVKACLMSEVAIYGASLSGNIYDVGEDCMKLPLFSFKNHVVNIRQWWWLKAVANSAAFAGAGYSGGADCTNASYSSGGVRPLICVG